MEFAHCICMLSFYRQSASLSAIRPPELCIKRRSNGGSPPTAYRRGFTLIELLVVIAIISIIAAILYPVFANAREKARQTQCASNLKQIGMAVAQYVQDYDEYYPYGDIANTTSASSTQWYAYSDWCMNTHLSPSWIDLVEPYAKTSQIFYCPDPPKGHFWSNMNYCGAAGTMIGNPNEPGYAMNPNIMHELLWSDSTFDNTKGKCVTGKTACYDVLNSSKVTRAAEIVMVADRGQADRTCLDAEQTNVGAASDPNGSWGGFSPNSSEFGTNPDWKHQDFADCLFVDGHTKAKKYTSTTDYKSMVGNSPYGL